MNSTCGTYYVTDLKSDLAYVKVLQNDENAKLSIACYVTANPNGPERIRLTPGLYSERRVKDYLGNDTWTVDDGAALIKTGYCSRKLADLFQYAMENWENDCPTLAKRLGPPLFNP